MPNVNVDLFVEQGSLNEATAQQSIGTDGCTLCVGVVAVMADGRKYCAHFDCNSQGTPAQLPDIQAATFAALNNNIQGVPNAMSACTTANLNMSTGAIWAGIQQFFQETAMNTTNGIYVAADGTIGTVTGNNQVIGANNAPENQIASIP